MARKLGIGVLLAVWSAVLFVWGVYNGTHRQADRKDAALNVIFSRKSVRSYADRSVSRQQADTLVRAAMSAPSSRNVQPWRFVLIDNRILLDSLAAGLPYAAMVAHAPLAVAVCADVRATTPGGIRSVSWMLDASAATENLLLAAEAMGLGAVWTGVYPYDDRVALVRRLLSLPDSVIPVSLVPVGYPAGNERPKDKYDVSKIHWNKWKE